MSSSIANHLFNAPLSRRQLLRLAGLGAAATAGLALGALPGHAAEAGDPAEFERLNELITAVQETLLGNPDLAGVRAISEWCETQPLGNLSADDQAAVTGALALAALDRLTTSSLSPEGVRAGLERAIHPDGFTAEYLAGLAEKTRAAMQDNPNYAKRVKQAAAEVEKARVRCTVNGEPAPWWMCVVVIIIIIVIILL